METKYFTIEQANALIPILHQEISRLQSLKQDFTYKMQALRQMKESGHSSQHAIDSDPYFMLEAEIEFVQLEAKNYLHTFTQRGVELKDIDLGLVDFPSVLHGTEVLLCWKLGEDKISFYHSRHDGFAGRKQIPE
jgi:hypothetical protein